MASVVECGRRLIVEFTCGRCGMVEWLPFNDSPDGQGFRTLVRAQPVPHNWRDETGDLPLLCPKCKAALDKFLNNQEVTE